MTTKTRGRLRPFSCGHKGFGGQCNRCAQGNQLLSRVEELSKLAKDGGKTLKTPEWVTLPSDNENKDVMEVRGGGRRFDVKMSGKMTGMDAFKTAIEQMKQEATRLLARSNNNKLSSNG